MEPKKILLAEDNEDHVFLCRKILAGKFKVDVARSGREVLEKIKRRRYDLVLLDYILPDVSGLEVLEKIKDEDNSVPVIMVTGQGSEDVAVKALTTGAIDYIVKTKSFHEGLVSCIEKNLEKYELQQEVRKTKDYLQRLVDSAPICIITTDLDGRIVSFNKHAEEVYGYKAEEVIGKHAGMLQPKEAQVGIGKETLEAIMVEERWEGELYNKRKNGQVFPIYLRTRKLLDENGKPMGTLSLAFDISEKKILEQQLMQYSRELERKVEELAESNRLKDLFADIMRHDLLNPIGLIRNYAELLLEERISETMREDLISIIKTSEKLISMIEDANKYEKLSSVASLKFEEKDLNEILKEAVKQFEPAIKEKQIKVEYLLKGSRKARVHSIIEDVFTNLLSNAIKYSPNGSTISINIQDKGKHFLISVADQGIGVPDEYKKAIFERFKRGGKRGVKGSGLGLAIVKRIMELHNGKVWVEDNPGGGSIFYVELPKG